MIVTADIDDKLSSSGPLLASIDVEWSKNYRIKNGNVPFCFSIMWLTLPDEDARLTETTFQYVSAYVESTDETQDLIDVADTHLAAVLDTATLVTGHQLSSDLAILINAARRPVPHLHAMRERWRARRTLTPTPLIDTRYDIDHLLEGASRRLVDVCTELRLDVTQPELRSASMTELHRRWLANGDAEARERVTVLNLRHSLSTALVALLGAKRANTPHSEVNVNQMLGRLADTYAWIGTPTFKELM